MGEAELLFGKRVKEIRKRQGLTQARLAEMVNLSVNYISQIETGEASPTFRVLVRLAEGLDVELKDLFDFATLQENKRA